LCDTQYFYIVEMDMHLNSISRMHCCVCNATMVMRTCGNITLYVNCLSCLFCRRRLSFSPSFQHCSTHIYRLLAVFSFSGKKSSVSRTCRCYLYSVFFHRCLWSGKTASSYLGGPGIFQLAEAILIVYAAVSFSR
jgi:hypothetical protein